MGLLSKPWDIITDVAHGLSGIPTAKEKRSQMNLINEQIKAYKDQSRMAKEERDRLKTERDTSKRRVQEKQIRSMRRQYQPDGMDEGVSDTLG